MYLFVFPVSVPLSAVAFKGFHGCGLLLQATPPPRPEPRRCRGASLALWSPTDVLSTDARHASWVLVNAFQLHFKSQEVKLGFGVEREVNGNPPAEARRPLAERVKAIKRLLLMILTFQE